MNERTSPTLSNESGRLHVNLRWVNETPFVSSPSILALQFLHRFHRLDLFPDLLLSLRADGGGRSWNVPWNGPSGLFKLEVVNLHRKLYVDVT